MVKSIYVAGASNEVVQVKEFLERLSFDGWLITYDWTASVLKERSGGKSSDGEVTEEARRQYARNDLDGVAGASWLWLMVPSVHSIGCWVELGAALADNWHADRYTEIVVSGPWEKTIFTSLVPLNHRFATHEEAFSFLKGQSC